MTDPIEPPPAPTASDKLAEIGRAAIAGVPIPGTGTVVEVLRQIFGTAYQRRQDAWSHRLYELVRELHERGVDVDELAGREEFVTAVHDASRIAVGEHLEEKLGALKAVLFNLAVAGPSRVADVRSLRYLRLIDELEPEHLLVLRRCGLRVLLNGKVTSGDPSDQAIVDDVDALEDSALLLRDLEVRHLVVGDVPMRVKLEEHRSRAGGAIPSRLTGAEVWRATFDTARITPLGEGFLDWLRIV